MLDKVKITYFIKDVLQSLEDEQLSNNASAAHHPNKCSNLIKNSYTCLVLKKTIKRNYCKGEHTIFNCMSFWFIYRTETTKHFLSCVLITLDVLSQHFNVSHWRIQGNLNLADPGFERPTEVDLLLGANVFWNLLLDGNISLG
nr:unnamed protein product [Callosobruchus analis]